MDTDDRQDETKPADNDTQRAPSSTVPSALDSLLALMRGQPLPTTAAAAAPPTPEQLKAEHLKRQETILRQSLEETFAKHPINSIGDLADRLMVTHRATHEQGLAIDCEAAKSFARAAIREAHKAKVFMRDDMRDLHIGLANLGCPLAVARNWVELEKKNPYSEGESLIEWLGCFFTVHSATDSIGPAPDDDEETQASMNAEDGDIHDDDEDYDQPLPADGRWYEPPMPLTAIANKLRVSTHLAKKMLRQAGLRQYMSRQLWTFDLNHVPIHLRPKFEKSQK